MIHIYIHTCERYFTELLPKEELPELMRGLGEMLTTAEAKKIQQKIGPQIDFPQFLNIMAARLDEKESMGESQSMSEKLDSAFKVVKLFPSSHRLHIVIPVSLVKLHTFSLDSCESWFVVCVLLTQVLDPKGQGFIPESEIVHLLTNIGDQMTKEEVTDMLADAERTPEGHVRAVLIIMTILYRHGIEL